MLLNHKQLRHFTLALLLGQGKPVSAEKIKQELNCSGPTLTRTLKEIRDTYSADIKYSKSLHTYQLTTKGTLTAKVLRRMKDEMAEYAALRNPHDAAGHFITLDKEKKRVVSLSLRMSVIRKIDTVVNVMDITRSEAIELLVEKYSNELVTALKQKK